jgi:hypothetical protein
VQDAAAFESICRNIDVFEECDWIFTEDRVSMMALSINGVFAVSEVRPELVSYKLELRNRGPVFMVVLVRFVMADDLLKKD